MEPNAPCRGREVGGEGVQGQVGPASCPWLLGDANPGLEPCRALVAEVDVGQLGAPPAGKPVRYSSLVRSDPGTVTDLADRLVGRGPHLFEDRRQQARVRSGGSSLPAGPGPAVPAGQLRQRLAEAVICRWRCRAAGGPPEAHWSRRARGRRTRSTDGTRTRARTSPPRRAERLQGSRGSRTRDRAGHGRHSAKDLGGWEGSSR